MIFNTLPHAISQYSSGISETIYYIPIIAKNHNALVIENLHNIRFSMNM